MIIRLNDQEYEHCLCFAQTCALNHQRIEFGQSDTKPRRTSEISRDNMIGKMAEVAFSKMLHDRYGLDIALDFNYYPRGKWDDQDAVINGWLIDVKATRKGGRWMLIEWSKLNFRQRQNMLSHLYVMASVDWDRENDLPHREVDLVGCASIQKLVPGVPTTVILRKGECIPNTHTHLQADNYGIRFSDLETDWDMVIKYILGNPPPDLTEYPNPYTGRPLHKASEPKKDTEKQRSMPAQTEKAAKNRPVGILGWLKKLLGF